MSASSCQGYNLLNTIQSVKRFIHQKFLPHQKQFICNSLIYVFTNYLLDRDPNTIYKKKTMRSAQKERIRWIAKKKE